MAGLSDRRGQILLIGGLLLAVSIIALAVVFNAAVGTSTLAGQAEQDVSERPIRAVQEEVRASVTDLMARAIKAHPRNRTAQIEYVRSNISTINREIQRYAAGSEQLVNVSWNGTTAEQGTFNSTYAKNSTSTHYGWHLENKTFSEFISPNGSDLPTQNWTVGTGNRVRNFELTVNVSELVQFKKFKIKFRESKPPGEPEKLFETRIVRTNSNFSSAPHIEVEGPQGPRGECRLNRDNNSSLPYNLHINFVNSTVNGEYCSPLDFFSHIDNPYLLAFENGRAATGTFQLTTDDGKSRVENFTSDRPQSYSSLLVPSNRSKWPGDWYRRLYGVMLDIEYYGPQVEYNTTIAVTPGEL